MNATNVNGWKEVEQTMGSLPLLGYACIWQMGGLSAEHGALEAAMTTVGLGDFVPTLPSPRVALHRALEALLRERDAQNTPMMLRLWGEEDLDAERRKPLIRSTNDYEREWLVLQLVQESEDIKKLSLRYATAVRFKIHKKTGHLICTTSKEGNIDAQNESRELAAVVTPMYDKFRNLHTSRDLSIVIKRVIDWASSITLRREGGAYFVPESAGDVIQQVRSLLETLSAIPPGGEPMFLALGVPDEERTRRDMSRAAHSSLLAEIDGAVAELDELLGRRDNSRAATFQARISQYMMIGSKIELYEEMLGARQREARTAVAALTARARECLEAVL